MSLKRDIDTAMTVGQLKEQLEHFDDNLPIYYQYPSGDYWHTVLASSIQGVEMTEVEWSDYHRTPKLIDGDKEREDSVAVVMIL